MKERPILFSGPMVRALLAGTKTQTRRVAKTEITMGHDSLLAPHRGKKHAAVYLLPKQAREAEILCPYGHPGDRLWVRETFARVPTACDSDELVFAADYQDGSDKAAGVKYTPAIHMPKDLARIWLEVTGVRVERLQSISENDCIAEGIHELPHQAAEPGCWWTSDVAAGAVLHGRTPRNAFQLLWESTGGDWHANPWCWVIDFKRVSPS